MRVVLIAKPPADDAEAQRVETVLTAVRAGGHEARARVTRGRGDAELFARGAASGRADLVLAMGGDGTINEVVNGLAGAPQRPRLGILPAGTANDFARGLGVPLDEVEAVAVALTGNAAWVDVARVNQRCFINVSTGGFGTEATRGAAPRAKRLLGPLAYALTGARRLRAFRPTSAAFQLDGRQLYAGPFASFAVGNSWRTGGGTRVTPRALRADGELDVLIVGNVSRFELLALLPDLRSGRHLESPDVLYVRGRSLRITADAPLRVNADGEPVTAPVLEYGVLERCLEVMVP